MTEWSGKFEMKNIDENFYQRIVGFDLDTLSKEITGYMVSVTQHYFRCRSRLASLSFLIRRPRGRKLLRVTYREHKYTLYHSKFDLKY